MSAWKPGVHEPLFYVKHEARATHRQKERYRQALRAARDAGHSYVEIAKAAGTTRQAVRQLLLREER